MKNKKGFTLIELLAVIVILAIIAVIATPIIIGIVNSAREDAKLRSVELYASELERAYMQDQMKATPEITASGAVIDLSALSDNITMNGEAVACTGGMSISSAGKITLAGCTVGGVSGFSYSDGKASK